MMRVPLDELLFSLSRSLDFVEQDLLGITTNHGKRVAAIAMHLARATGLEENAVFDLAVCAVLHDNALTGYMLEVGTDAARNLEKISLHCQKGEENARAFPFLEDVSGVILHHHENWNGTGLHGLAGKNIPLRAAMIRLADSLDTNLPLGKFTPDGLEAVRSHVRDQRAMRYNPDLADIFLHTASTDFLQSLRNDHVDSTLAALMPSVRIHLSTDQLRKVCTLFSLIIDAKSPFTRVHSQNIARKAEFMGARYGLDAEHCARLFIAAALHDVGKLGTPLSILEKPGKLTSEEMDVMRHHAALSWEILQSVSGLEEVTLWGASHHEKLNGNGYPKGFGAGKLNFECRLIACCDIHQALTEDRPYRPGMNHAEAIRIMTAMAQQGEIDADIVSNMAKTLQADKNSDSNSVPSVAD